MNSKPKTTPSRASKSKATVQAASRRQKTPLAKLAAALPWILVICGIIGTIASVMITVEKFDLLQNPNYHPVCDLNPIISCGSVMESKQASAFGFTNTYIGLVGFPVILTIGMAMFAGARFKRWFWLSLQVGLSLGMLFAYWLLYESVYRIGALCPYCLSVDLVLTTAWWYVSLHNFYQGYLRWPARLKAAGAFAKSHHADLLVLWFLIVTALILKHFWYYFGQHLF